MKSYKILKTKPTSSYNGNVFTQKVLIQSELGDQEWVEDNLMIIKPSDRIIPSSVTIRANINGYYKNKEEIPKSKIGITHKARLLGDGNIMLRSFIYKLSQKLSDLDEGAYIYVCIYLKDMVYK